MSAYWDCFQLTSMFISDNTEWFWELDSALCWKITHLSKLRNLLKTIDKARDYSVLKLHLKSQTHCREQRRSREPWVLWLTAQASLCNFSFPSPTAGFRGLHKILETVTDAYYFETSFASSVFLVFVFLNVIDSSKWSALQESPTFSSVFLHLLHMEDG